MSSRPDIGTSIGNTKPNPEYWAILVEAGSDTSTRTWRMFGLEARHWLEAHVMLAGQSELLAQGRERDVPLWSDEIPIVQALNSQPRPSKRLHLTASLL